MNERPVPTRPERFTSTEEFEYRRLQARAFDQARKYDGSEKADTELFRELEAWERFIETHVKTGTPRDKEAEAALTWNEHHPKEIADALEIASKAFARSVQDSLTQNNPERKGGIAQEYFNDVFLPPKGMPELPGISEQGHSFTEQEEEFDQIVEDFLTIVREYGVYADDVILTRSKQPEDSRRKESYVKIEIPRINRTALLCNQKRQVTILIEGTIANTQLAKWSKHELLAQTEIPARSVNRGNQWKDKVLDLLFTEEAWHNPEYKNANARHRAAQKIDIGQLQEYRRALIEAWQAKYTPESFIETGTDIPRSRLDDGTSGILSAKILGIPGACKDEMSRLQFALCIWPNHPRILKEIERATRTPSDWKRALEELGWTPKKWIETKSGPHRRIKFDDYMGVIGLASLFGVSGKPLQNTIDWLRVGQAIWPESEEITHAIRVERRTPKEWIQRIREVYTPKQWIELLRAPGYQVPSLDGKGPAALAQRCEYSEIIIGNDPNAIMRFGQFIWPESKEIAREIEIHKRSAEDWRRAIQQKITPEEWLRMTSKEALQFEVDGLGITGLAAKLGLEDRTKNMEGNRQERLRFGVLIWPGNPDIEKAFTEAQNKTSRKS